MSGYLWTALPPNVRGSIDTQPDGDAATKECGCDNRGGKWWLCQYHSGFHDAETALIDRLETELSRSHGKARWGCRQCPEGDDDTVVGDLALVCLRCGTRYYDATVNER